MRGMQPIRKVVFPVGGLGTRFLPATKSMPKEMLPIVDKPLIHYAFEEARDAGIEQFIFVTGRNKDAIENHFDHAYELERSLSDKRHGKALATARAWLPEPGSVTYLRQQEPLGLGHAVWCARHVVGNEPFAVILADDLVNGGVPCLKQMVEAYRDLGAVNMAAVMDVPQERTANYGILDPMQEDGKLVQAKALVEKPLPAEAPSTISIIGRYILQPSIFAMLEGQKRGAGGEIQLTDAMNQSIGGPTPFYGYRFDGTRYDCGEVAGYVEANVALSLERPELAEKLTPRLKALLG